MIIKILFWGTNRQQRTLPYGKTFTVQFVGSSIKSTVNVATKIGRRMY